MVGDRGSGENVGITPADLTTGEEWSRSSSARGVRAAAAPAPKPAPSLEDLARRAAAGEGIAFHALVDASHAAVHRLALRTTGSAAEADDVVQEVYVRAWSTLMRQASPEAVMPWLYGVARHVAADWVRARRRRPAERVASDEATRAARQVADPAPSAAAQIEAAQRAAAVRAAVDALPDKHRVILLLREVDGLSYGELAEAIGCPIGTVESRLYRARTALARRLVRLVRA